MTVSYGTMDHAGWVEMNGAAAKSMGAKARKDSDGNVLGWTAMPVKLSPFQAKVMDICGMSLGGIYNAPITWDAVLWGNPASRYQRMAVPLYSTDLCTWDSNRLTLLVLGCHEARIRLAVCSNGTRGLKLYFSQRDASDSFLEGHPDIDQAVAKFREYIGQDHRITYQARVPEAVA